MKLLVEAQREQPNDPALVHLTGLALLKLQQTRPAIGAFYHALELSPADAEVHANLATALLADGGVCEAEHHAQQAYALAPTAANAATLSCALIETGRLAEALALTDDWAASTRPSPEMLVNRSIALEGVGRAGDAVASARAAFSTSPTPIIEHHLATLLLSQGHLTEEAWNLYEARRGLNQARRWPDETLRWIGQDVRGKTVLLHAEQGLGDTLQFVRYAPLVAARGADVVLVVQSALKRLLAETPGVATILAVGETLPAFDLYSPLLSLPGIFGTTLATIPPALPYPLGATQRRPGPLRVGLAWAGNTGFIEDRKRSIGADKLWRLGSDLPIELLSLQLSPGPLPPNVRDVMADVRDMADTVIRITTLDVVITVDTAVAHLAATMNKPVWLLSRFRGCWRWLDGRTDSPWYPSLTIYRQPLPGDWDSVLTLIRADLEHLCWR